ncbi:MAG: NAD(P)/FAD-dependent oxidoreductase [Cyclobacteriaceae bacterium]|nr:hypothetical protein [Cytophagales bacterium]HNP78337.1 NAD(P)/FAD-dependent oxidoreductase [Cyclobacteriaceae bacterium]
MNRREVIERLGWGLTGSMLMPSLISSCSPKDPGPEVAYSGTVAVIGAGASGLYVADILRSKGIKVTIFEARDQLGGRVRSLRNQSVDQYPRLQDMSSDFPVELGAQTIVGSDSIMGKVYTAYGLVTLDNTALPNNYVIDNLSKLETDWAGDADFVAAKNFATNLRSFASNTGTVQQAITASGINPRVNGVLNALVGNKRGATNEQGGVGAWAQEAALIQNDGKVMVLKANPMHDVLISRFSNVQSLVNINTPIVSINYSADPIVLTAKDGSTYQANKVIVTVPISQLKSNAIAFTPGLPGGITGSLAKFEMGASYRAVIEFKKNFWGDTIGYILGSGDVPEYFSIGVGRSQFNATLSVTVNGSKAAKYSAMKNDDAILAILADLDVLYAGQATKYVRQVLNTTTNIYVVEDWSKIAYIGGGYAYPLPGATSTDRKNLSAPVNNVLFFAGEATDVSGQAGTVNGALASAERCAQEVITSITKA